MPSILYTIGEFASVNKITTRMLRHYDKIGLLKPAAILANGYRAYSSEQIKYASLIKQYRECEFSLPEIKSLLREDEREMKQLIERKILELQQRELGDIATVEKLNILSGKKILPIENRYEIAFSERKEQRYAYLNEAAEEHKIEQAFQRLHRLLDENAIIPCGVYMLLSNMEEPSTYYAGVPVKEHARAAAVPFSSLGAAWYVSTIHYGDYDHIAEAYDRLLSCLKERSLTPHAPFMERYFLDSSHAANPAEYITEVSIKIAP